MLLIADRQSLICRVALRLALHQLMICRCAPQGSLHQADSSGRACATSGGHYLDDGEPAE